MMTVGTTCDEVCYDFLCGPAGGHESEMSSSGSLPTVVPSDFGGRG